MPLSIRESSTDAATSSSPQSARLVEAESLALATGRSLCRNTAERAAFKRPTVDPKPSSACKKLCQGTGSLPRASPPFDVNLATTFSSSSSPPTTVVVTVGGVPSVNPTKPCLASVTKW
ncbi:hypothetical protein E2562_018228 [Oryza meyeriana var. granulata]|uniref:Uncharacterized protein n=1 Tax=Oryza meyeriana var. granulata TaxID=110450 RepID=A0A6G1CIA4_9ORYZ|nr:hypothetical protein E2562_018228 [Oryza meyeriana var. granulata]